MSIRKNTNPRSLDLSPELQDILVRNGMQAHITGSSNGFQLVVQGHDSPFLPTTFPRSSSRHSPIGAPTSSTSKRTTPSQDWFKTILTFPRTLFTHAMPTAESPWVSMATASVKASTAGWHDPFGDGIPIAGTPPS